MKKQKMRAFNVLLSSMLVTSTLFTGCGSNTNPSITEVEEQVAVENIETEINSSASTTGAELGISGLSAITGEKVNNSSSGEIMNIGANVGSNTHSSLGNTASNIYNSATLLDELYSDDMGNVLISPLSFNIAISMLSEGSTSTTKEMLTNYLASTNYSEIAKYYYTLNDESIQSSNSIWVQENYTLNEDFNSVMNSKYGTNTYNVNFANTKDAVDKINGWSYEKTNGLIPKIVSEDDIEFDTISVLVNSLYFNSEWLIPWETIGEKTFYNIDGTTSSTEYIKQTVNSYYENDEAIAFGYYYADGVKFIGILPKVEDATTDFDLTSLNIDELLNSSIDMPNVTITMPILHQSYDSSFVNALTRMGMGDLFSGKAEIYGVVQDENLMITNILQSCRIDLDENSTTAAASTAIIGSKGLSVQSGESIHLNRPYAYLIYDETTNQVLFMGKIVSFE